MGFANLIAVVKKTCYEYLLLPPRSALAAALPSNSSGKKHVYNVHLY